MSTEPENEKIIYPKYKLVLSLDVAPEFSAIFTDFLNKDVIPVLVQFDVYLIQIWFTSYGDYPEIMAEFASEEYQYIEDLLSSDDWVIINEIIADYTNNYTSKVVKFHNRFQFVANN